MSVNEFKRKAYSEALHYATTNCQFQQFHRLHQHAAQWAFEQGLQAHAQWLQDEKGDPLHYPPDRRPYWRAGHEWLAQQGWQPEVTTLVQMVLSVPFYDDVAVFKKECQLLMEQVGTLKKEDQENFLQTLTQTCRNQQANRAYWNSLLETFPEGLFTLSIPVEFPTPEAQEAWDRLQRIHTHASDLDTNTPRHASAPSRRRV